MYIDSINSQNTDYAISSFQETLINAQPNDMVKTIDFSSGYNLDSNLSFNIMFKNGHICSANNKPMTLNGKAIKVYSYSDPTLLVDLPMNTFDSKIWTLRPNTSLELYYNGEQFIVVGNPIVYTTDDCDYYANGKVEYKKSIVTTQNTVNDSCNVLLQGNQIGSSGYYNVNTACGCTLTFNSGTGVLTATTFNGALNGKANSACSADNASKFDNKTYTEVKTDIQSSMVSMTNIGTNIYPLALCTGANTISSSSSLTFNASEGVLTATKFCGSFCGTADNAIKFDNKDYSTVCSCIRSGLTDCLGTVTWGDKGDSTFYPITFCTGDKVIGVTSNTNMEFKYNPSTSTLCVNNIYIKNVSNVGYSETKIKNGTSYTRFFNTANNLNLYIQTTDKKTALPSDVYNILHDYSFTLWCKFPTYGTVNEYPILYGERVKTDYDEPSFIFVDCRGCEFEFTDSKGSTNVKLCIFY